MQKLKISVIALLLVVSSFSFITVAEAKEAIVNPHKVYTYKQMVKDIYALKKAYPELINVKTIGKSEYGRKIYAVSIGTGNANLFVNGSHHAREWMTTSLNMYMLENYAAAYKKKKKINGYDTKKILNSTTIWFVPMVNPDGVTLQQSGLKAFPKNKHKSLTKMNNGSKNFNRWKANGKGVDLNRQYNAGWEAINSPKNPSYKNYKGKAPETAAETKAILKFVDEINPEMAVSYHSTGRILFWNYKQTGKIYKRDYKYAKQIGKMTGYSLVFPGKNPSGGGFTDWFISAKKRPGFTPEISRAYYETSPPLSEFPGAWRENQAVGLYTAQESSKLYLARMNAETAKLEKKLINLYSKSKKLNTYYYANIKTQSNLKIDKNLPSLYNSVTKEAKTLRKQIAVLPAKNQKKLSGYFDKVNYYTKNSKLFMDGIQSGENLLAANKQLDYALTIGKIDSSLINKHKSLANSKSKTEKVIKNMNRQRVRSLATSKYILPVRYSLENTQLDIDRYTLSLSIEELIQNGNIDEAATSLKQLEEMELKSLILKEKDPNKFKMYPKVEEQLQQMKQSILEKLNNAQETEVENIQEE
ncbi:M14 family zinc carboxypeptidase [Mesobacillus subterraneus]|uniref:Peptidase M14 n=1 Tax=Mesobacillus subterraneus TaxID=285983 RepID=A0A427TEA8_9BACI|nr:M14 family zinc carboxypeptidase [Mesobacillus subterraneus]RSD21128.1 peptidase M14 [Mesobacillus subterraneus]